LHKILVFFAILWLPGFFPGKNIFIRETTKN
jgi:hypothetical protein